MTPREIIRQAQADGVQLRATSAGKLKATGNQVAIIQWLPTLRAHKPAIIAELTKLPADLEPRIRAMAQRWGYSDDELSDVLTRAWRDPAGWMRAVTLDESREQEFRERGLLPRADA